MDSDYSMTSYLFRELAGAAIIVPFMLWMLAFGPLVLYPMARWRSNKQPPDPQLGLKVALGYFGMIAFQTCLVGATIVLFTLFSKLGDYKGTAYRVGFGFLVPGAILLGTHIALLGKTNEALRPGVRKLIVGFNMILTGLVATTAIVVLFQLLFAKGSAGDALRFVIALTLVYGAGWSFLIWDLTRTAMDDTASAGPSDHTASPGTPAPAAAAQGSALPALGGGSFPPIEPK